MKGICKLFFLKITTGLRRGEIFELTLTEA